MKNTLALVVLIFLSFFSKAQGKQHWYDQLFIAESNYVVYGDKVNLREAPSQDSPIKTTLGIGQVVVLKELTSEVIRISSHDSLWARIELLDGTMGYLPATFLATGEIPLEDEASLLYKVKNINGQLLLFVRQKFSQSLYQEMGAFTLNNRNFSIELQGSRGLSTIENIIKIQYLAESCGEQGGATYLVFDRDKDELLFLAHTSSVGDGGVFHVHEELIFPNDPDGRPGFIIYTGEEGELIDERSETYKTVSFTRPYKWVGLSTLHPIQSIDVLLGRQQTEDTYIIGY